MPRKILTSVVLSHHGDTEPRRRSINSCYGKASRTLYSPRLRVSVSLWGKALAENFTSWIPRYR
jgi:hypothetical protein